MRNAYALLEPLKRKLFKFAGRSMFIRESRRWLDYQWFKTKLPFLVLLEQWKEGAIRADELIIERFTGDIIPATANRRICVFVHFDPHNIVDEYVKYYVTALCDLGFEILFVSASQGLSLEDVNFLKSKCIRIILKKNVGYDFGSWKIGINEIPDIRQCRQLVLANDSVYGPLFPLNEMFDVMETKGYDMWGITDSHDFSYHIQSFFFVFNSEILQGKAFREFWDNFRFYSNKWVVVSKYELGTTKYFKDRYTLGVYCRYDDIAPRFLLEHSDMPYRKYVLNGRANPMHFFWKELIVEHRCPFIKKELLRDHPVDYISINGWYELLAKHTHYKPELIIRNLHRVAGAANCMDDHTESS